jgi:cell division septal protein FtsQ
MQQKSLLKSFWDNKQRRFLLGAGSFLAIIVLSSLLYFIWEYYKVTTFEVRGLDKKEVLSGMKEFKRSSIFFLNSKEVEKRIYVTNPKVKKARVIKKYPHTLEIAIEHHTPLACIEGSNGFFVVSEDARILSKVQGSCPGLVTIHYYEKLNPHMYKTGSKVDHKDIMAALYFYQKARGLSLAIISIDIRGFDMIALSTADQRFIFSIEKNYPDQGYQFEKVVHELKIQGKHYKKLDFRYDRVILES